MKHIVGRIVAAGLLFCIAASVSAQSSSSVTLNFTGKYELSTCEVTSPHDMTVTLPKISTQALSTSGATAGATLFSLSFRCGAGAKSARVYFEGGPAVDPATGNLKPQNIGGATSAGNVQVMLSNADGSPIKIGDPSTMKIIPVISTKPMQVNFIASYRATGRATAGQVSTFVSYVIEML